MRWLQKSSQAPQLIGLSPLKTDDSLSISNHSINLIDQKPDTNYETNQSTRKSRKDFSSFRTLTWSKKFAKSTENCYSIQEGRVIDRSREVQCDSPVQLKNINKTFVRSSSPSNQSISSIKTISTSTPTYFTTLRRLHRHKLASVLDFDKEVWRNNHNSQDDDNLSHHKRISSIIDEDVCHKDFYCKSELNRTFCGVPYREKRNPLNHTRLSCYKPLIREQQFDIKNLKNFKSVDDFLSLDMNNAQSSTDHLNDADMMTKMSEKDENIFNQKHKRKGLSSKFRTMSDKTQKLFSKLYSNSNLKSTPAESSNDITVQQNSKRNLHTRRSLSYGTLTQVKEFDAKKIEAEDGDSGILISESGASSMTDENSETNKKVDHDELFKIPPERKYVQRIEIRYNDENTNEEQNKNEPKICSSSCDKQKQHNASCTDLSLASSTLLIEKTQKNCSVDSGLNDTKGIESTTKCNSVTENVSVLEKNDNITKFNTLNHPRRSKGTTLVINHEDDTFDTSSALNMCDDDKLKLKTAQSKEKIDDNVNDKHSTPSRKMPCTNFCTLPRKAKTSPHCTFHTVTFEKGPGKKSLGFTIVGGADSPRGALGIFIKSILPKGQAIENGLLKAGDEVLVVNGHVCHDLTHQDAIKLFKSVKSGEIVLNICRRKGSVAVT